MTELTNIVAIERTIDIKHPRTGVAVGLAVTLLPETHPKVRAESRRILNERINNRSKTTAEKSEASRLDMLVAAVSEWDWKGELTFRGTKPGLTPPVVREVLETLPWVADQIDSALGDQTEFFRSPEEAGD